MPTTITKNLLELRLQQREHRKLLVNALRSGKYTQGMSCLHSSEGSFCCLGVAEDVRGCEWHQSCEGSNYHVIHRDAGGVEHTYSAWLSPEGQEYYGFKTAWCGYVGNNNSLMSMNDEGIPFSDIADLI